MFPGEEPGSLLRYSQVDGIIKEEDWRVGEYRVLNTYRGFTIKPIGVIDPVLMRKIVTALDIMLGLLTRDNQAQMDWLKKFIAWTIKFPDKKQQVAPVIVGGQGIGKSVFGENLMQALFGNLCGTASAGLLTDNAFLITPFIGKLMTFVDEVRLETAGAINEIKKIVRQKRISGQLKFKDQQDHEIYSRLILASNHADIGLTSQDAADRALFFIVSWTARNKDMNDAEFQPGPGVTSPFIPSSRRCWKVDRSPASDALFSRYRVHPSRARGPDSFVEVRRECRQGDNVEDAHDCAPDRRFGSRRRRQRSDRLVQYL